MEVFELLINSPLITALAIIAGAFATILYTDRRERSRMEHERSMRLRDERIAAYRRLLAATTTAHTEREAVEALAAAQAEISLIAGSPELAQAAEKVWVRYGAAQRTADKTKKDPTNTSAGDFAKALTKAEDARDEFLRLAREELEVDPGKELPSRRGCEAPTAARIASPGVAVVGSSMGLVFEDERPRHLGKF